MNTTVSKGDWNIFKGKILEKYPELTGDDLAYEEGQDEEILARIRKKAPKAADEVRDFLSTPIM